MQPSECRRRPRIHHGARAVAEVGRLSWKGLSVANAYGDGAGGKPLADGPRPDGGGLHGLWLLERALATIDDALLITESGPLDEPGPRVVYVNEAFTRMTGFTAADITGRSPRMMQGEETDRTSLDQFRRSLETQTPIRVELVNYHRDGAKFWVELMVRPLRDDSGVVTHFVSTQRDVTKRKRAEADLAGQLLRSEVTGLLNRTGFVEEIDRALDGHRPGASPPVVVLFDVQGLRHLNYRFGRDVGDQALVEVGRRLQLVVGRHATVAQLAGGEFGLLIFQATTAEVVSMCERASRALLAPVRLPDVDVALVVSGGVAVDGDGSTAVTLLREADVARRAALSTGTGRYEFYEASMGGALERRLDLDQGLRGAVRDGELLLHHQLIVDLQTGIAGRAEALVRWNRAGHGLVSPAEFIPVAEETGAILSVGAWVLYQACRQAADWQAQLPGMGVAVNLSPRQLADPDLLDDVLRALDLGLAPGLLLLEITEGALVDAPEAASVTLRRLRDRGIRVALDDFGTGYSSLAYLKRLPVDVVKIDKTFVDGVEHDAGDRAVIQSVLTLTGAMGLAVVAEGVETQAQRAALLELGCRQAQGYLFARPEPAAGLAAAAEHAAGVAAAPLERRSPVEPSSRPAGKPTITM